jgi:hypothetical protein
MLRDYHLARRKRLFQYIDGSSWIGLAAHEDIEGGVAVFGPAVDRYVRFGKHSHARHSAVRREVMQVDM